MPGIINASIFNTSPPNEVHAKPLVIPTMFLACTSSSTNRFDPNAVKILRGDDFLGYVPKKFSSEVSALLSIGAPVVCTVDEVNPAAKTYEMFKVTVSIPVEEEIPELENDGLED